VKRKEFIRILTLNGCVLVRHGSRHDVYQNPMNGAKQPVPRHTEIENILADHIKKHLGVK